MDGAELVVILTNQASYGESGMSDQFILMSMANAISNERPIVHAAITGKSAFIDKNTLILYLKKKIGLYTNVIRKITTSQRR